MSSNESRQREAAKRVTAAELYEAEEFFKESDSEYAPNYLLLPSGDKANRVLIAGALTELEDVSNDDNPYWKARISDGSGRSILVYAGQYQPEAQAQLRRIHEADNIPCHVTIVAKPKSYEPDDSDDIIVTLRPESVNIVDRETRFKAVTDICEKSIERLNEMSGEYVEKAADYYGDEGWQNTKQGVITALENANDSLNGDESADAEAEA